MAVASPPLPSPGHRVKPGFHGQSMSIEDFLAIPYDGVRRQLINGIVEEDAKMSYRNRFHARVSTNVTALLEIWLRQYPDSPLTLYSSDVGTILERKPKRVVAGIDIALFTRDVIRRQAPEVSVVEGIPELAVEILSPTDRQDRTTRSIERYLHYGVPHIWIVNPQLRDVMIYRPSARPLHRVGDDEIRVEPQMPGFVIATSELFTQLE